MNDRPLGCSVFYSTLLPYGFTLKLFTFLWAIEKCVSICVDKIDIKLKILWLSTFIDKLNLSIDNYRQILSIIDLSTTFSMIDFDRHVTSWVLAQCLQRWLRAQIASIIHCWLYINLSFSSMLLDRDLNRTRWWLDGLWGSSYWRLEHISLGDGWRATFHCWWMNHFKTRKKSFH